MGTRWRHNAQLDLIMNEGSSRSAELMYAVFSGTQPIDIEQTNHKLAVHILIPRILKIGLT